LITILPAAVIGWQSTLLTSEAAGAYIILLPFIPVPIFAAFMTLAIGTVFRIGWVAAASTSILSFMTLIGMPLLMQAATFICASPLLLLLLLFLLRDRIDDFMRSARARQSFKQNLEAATLNPADSSAHYNLGLLYQTRGDFDSAADAFRKAVEIDGLETDAHYQLGRIARQQGRLDEAIAHFEKVVQQNVNHSHHEIWRETGLVYYEAGQYQDALAMLDKFLGERPSDAQGRYWRGMTLYQLGRTYEASQEMQECIETVKTAPAYKYRTERQWLHQAESFLRERK
jgi:tetratricopeptide (TPR) repeat protein